MAREAEIRVADGGDAAVARGGAGVVLGDQTLAAGIPPATYRVEIRNRGQRGGRQQRQARPGPAPRAFALLLYAGALAVQVLEAELFEAGVVALGAGVGAGAAAVVALVDFAAAGLPDGVEGGHVGFAAGFFFRGCFRVRDYGVEAGALAFAGDELFVGEGGGVVGGEGEDGA